MAARKGSPPALLIEVSPGELIDKMSILEIKSERIDDSSKLKNVLHELALYRDIFTRQIQATEALTSLRNDLKATNEALWNIEDEIRECEAQKDFGERFIELARSVYRTNDRRASLKRDINILCGSSIVEEKSYTQY